MAAPRACARQSAPSWRTVVDKALDRLLPAKLPCFHWLTGLMDDAMLSAGIQFSEDLLFDFERAC
jgi:hypothetical protein